MATSVFSIGGYQLIILVMIITSLLQVHVYEHFCSPSEKYRTLDGYCNNLEHPSWGQADTLQKRLEDLHGPMVEYADGRDLPRGYNQGYLPSAREVTNLLMDSSKEIDDLHDKFRSGINMAWGQFLTHDIIDTKLHSGVPCCKKNSPNRTNIDICFPINVPKNDKVFPAGCKDFNRAVRASNLPNLPKHREHISRISSYVDATFLYGTTTEQQEQLRQQYSFLMKADKCDLLPTIDGGSCLKLDVKDRCPLAGDNRVGEAPNLGLLHVLFLREHNYIANKLHQINPTWDYERVFQETRRIIIAITQHVSYNRFLPTIISDAAMRKHGLYSKHEGFYKEYDAKVDASIFNSMGFAFRFGHSQIMPTQSLLHRNFTLEDFKVENTLESPHVWQTECGKNIPPLARWLALKPAMKSDIFFVSGVKDKLFFKTDPHGLDLPAITIHRGRDHGTPAYNRWRELCGLSKLHSFSQFGKNGWKLATLYKSVDDIDFFVGASLEQGHNGRVGPTFECIIGRQFHNLKRGDRFWYETDHPQIGFTEEQLNSIRSRTFLSRIYCRHFGLKHIQPNIFALPMKRNPLVPCDDIPEIDLSLWKDRTEGEYGGDVKYSWQHEEESEEGKDYK